MAVMDLKLEHESGQRSKNSFKRVDTVEYSKKRGRRNANESKKEKPTTIHGDDDQVMEMYKDYDLYLAAKNGELDAFQRILDRVSAAGPAEPVDILSRLSPNGNTFLHVAATHGNHDIVIFIASMVPSLVLAKNFDGDTALHLVARAGGGSMVQTLVRTHRSFLIHNPGEENNLLLVKNERGNTAFHEAILSNLHSIALFLIREDPELLYQQNDDTPSALFSAAKFGFVNCVREIFRLCTDEARLNELFKKRSPIETAIQSKHMGVLEVIFNTNPSLIEMRDELGRNPLHFAASAGHLEEARYLLKRHPLNVTRRDKNGLLPIHVASERGHVDIVSLLIQDFPDPWELVDKYGCNILHVAAKSGRYNVFSFVFDNPHLECLINMKDKLGNTPLHLASKHFHPKIVSALTWDKRVDVEVVNNHGMSPLDIAEHNMPHNPQFSQRLTWAALKSAGIPRNLSKHKGRSKSKSSVRDEYKERVNTLLLVATLVATVTFAAGFTMPGGYIESGSGANSGIATMLSDRGFHVFVFCDTLAMYCSTLVATALIWAQLGDLKVALTALTLAQPLLGIALGMMSMAFIAGIFIVVSNLGWLGTVILVMSIPFVAIMLLLLLPLCTPFTSSNRIMRHLSYYPFYWLMLAST